LQHLRAFGIPEIKHYGYNSAFNILIMELLGQSLENLFQAQNKSFSIKTACMLGVQMIDRIEYVHSRKIIHRDIKPDNFVMGRGLKSHIVYILDFGLSKKYWSVSHKCHLPFIRGKKLTGTARYASINALSGCEQSRRDDLESIGYIIMYFIRGSLPWQGLKVNKKEDRYKKICEKKKETSAKDLCAGFPSEFETFVSYTRNLQFTEVPNYNYLRNLLKTILKKGGYTFDFDYDWCTTKPHIKPDDPIFTNDYKIEYNGPYDWLNSETIKELEMKENGNNDNVISNKVESNLGNSYPTNHIKAEGSNIATKYTDSKNKKNMNFPGSKKYK
jgi:serine/threonine protein kinase